MNEIPCWKEWEALLSYVISLAEGRSDSLTLVLDEFPYICETVEALPSILQKIFDASVAGDILKEDAAKTDYGDDADKVHWMLISKSGFTDELRQRASHSDTLHLVTTADLMAEPPG